MNGLRLEAVQVEHQHCGARAFADDGAEGLLESFIEESPVGQTRGRIMARQLLRRRFRLSARGYFAPELSEAAPRKDQQSGGNDDAASHGIVQMPVFMPESKTQNLRRQVIFLESRPGQGKRDEEKNAVTRGRRAPRRMRYEFGNAADGPNRVDPAHEICSTFVKWFCAMERCQRDNFRRCVSTDIYVSDYYGRESQYEA